MQERKEEQMTREQFFLRISALCVIVGSAAVFAFRAAHGDPPGDMPEEALRVIASYPNYAGVHLGAILGVVIWVIGLRGLSGTLTGRVAYALGWLGAASALMGAAIFIVDFSIDGAGGQALADRWAATVSPSERADLVRAADTVLTALRGTSLVAIAILWGLPLVLFGLAVAWEDYYPHWLGWTGMVVGAATFAAAIAQYLQPDIIQGVLIYGLLVSIVQLWSIGLGVAMWRRVRLSKHLQRPHGNS